MNLLCGAVLHIVEHAASLLAPAHCKSIGWVPCPAEKHLQAIRNAHWRETHSHIRNRILIYKHVDVVYYRNIILSNSNKYKHHSISSPKYFSNASPKNKRAFSCLATIFFITSHENKAHFSDIIKSHYLYTDFLHGIQSYLLLFTDQVMSVKCLLIWPSLSRCTGIWLQVPFLRSDQGFSRTTRLHPGYRWYLIVPPGVGRCLFILFPVELVIRCEVTIWLKVIIPDNSSDLMLRESNRLQLGEWHTCSSREFLILDWGLASGKGTQICPLQRHPYPFLKSDSSLINKSSQPTWVVFPKWLLENVYTHILLQAACACNVQRMLIFSISHVAEFLLWCHSLPSTGSYFNVNETT